MSIKSLQMLVTHELMLKSVHFSLNPLITYLNASNDSKVCINMNNIFLRCKKLFTNKSMPDLLYIYIYI